MIYSSTHPYAIKKISYSILYTISIIIRFVEVVGSFRFLVWVCWIGWCLFYVFGWRNGCLFGFVWGSVGIGVVWCRGRRGCCRSLPGFCIGKRRGPYRGIGLLLGFGGNLALSILLNLIVGIIGVWIVGVGGKRLRSIF